MLRTFSSQCLTIRPWRVSRVATVTLRFLGEMVWQYTYFGELLVIISIRSSCWLSSDGSFSCTQHLGYYPISWKGISTTPEAFAFERARLLTLFAINLECDRTGPRESNIRANRWMTIVLLCIRTKGLDLSYQAIIATTTSFRCTQGSASASGALQSHLPRTAAHRPFASEARAVTKLLPGALPSVKRTKPPVVLSVVSWTPRRAAL